MINQQFQNYLPEVINLFIKHKIQKAYLFGSILTEKFNEKSDIDFLVNIQDNLDPVEAGGHLWDLEDELQILLNRNVDLLSERALKNPYLINEIRKTRISIYG